LLDRSNAALAAAASPTRAPREAVVDLAHLFRMTLGDHDLEREVLQLFSRQADMLIARMQGAAPAGIAAMAHTLKGSARGIGAWRVAHAADAVEVAAAASRQDPDQVVDHDCGQDLTTAIEALRSAAAETCVTIADLLRAR
jgi:HPt (histidine-containing phosphotransfer) domain-containing protein